ncbi:hypothetical protein [Pseudomonas fluorescens]|uniref:Uncharacterized protein n=1 Tax=Pseudomonas fluorescens TaxID=294 RepID=A0A7Z3GZ10_PSEFL|nr:hypothetical protein [Pseudomonas fluorescens]QJP93944.1 hypothetical protein C6Y56_04820 [Pseudomonas fluorescens]
MFADIKTVADVGTLDAKIHGFKFPDFEGRVTFFFDGSSIGGIYLISKQEISDTEWNEFSLVVSPDIQAKRYELPNAAVPIVPNFREVWIDEHGETYSRNYVTDQKSGHFTVEKIDIKTGEFKAEFNVGIRDEGKRHQAVGKINVTGWSEVKN